MFSAC